ncbi:MAG: sigma-70 family RNA polymerase sigma factor [Gemmataceae bacterium]
MSATRPGHLLRRLAPPDPDDGPLLARFAADRDAAAFAALVRRHGPLVLAVCRRVCGHPQDAEDAFQAVFLVLARKAGGLRDPGRLGNWLYGVAAKVASRARRAAARRRVREVQAVDPPDPAAPDAAPPADIGPALHEELAALPAHYREPIVLCDLQGASRAEAAKALGVPEGTLSSRLANGRKKLAERLTRRGVALSAVGVPAAVAEGRAAVPEALVQHTCGVVAAWAAGAAVPASVLRLAAGGFPVRTVLLGGVLALSLVAGVVVAGSGPNPAAVPNPAPPVAAAVEEPLQPPADAEGPKSKGVAVGAPRLQEALDLPIRLGRRVVWSPTGDRFVVTFPPEPGPGVATAPGGDGSGEALMVVNFALPQGAQVYGATKGHDPERFVGFTPDGNEFLMTRREHGLVSGRHQAAFYVFGTAGRGLGLGGPPGTDGAEGSVTTPLGRLLSLVPTPRRFTLDNEQSNEFAFAPDGKTYRTLFFARDAHPIRKVVVRRVSAETGKLLDTVATVEGRFATAQLSADGKRLLTIDEQTKEVVSHDVGYGPGWAVHVDLKQPDGGDRIYPTPLGLSRDGGRVLVSRAFGRPAVLDGATGKTLPVLEGAELINAQAAGAVFTGDGRLMALPYENVEKKETALKGGGPRQTSFTATDPRLGVWDVTTGKLLRSWPGRVTAMAFHPTRPVLAVLEPNGAQTRLGLWDFAAE